MADEKDTLIKDLREQLGNSSTQLAKMKEILAKKGIDWNEESLTLTKKTNGNTDCRPHPLLEKLELTNSDIFRYSRQLILPEIGVQGQLKLCNTSVLIVGAGGLGCPAAMYLAAAGIGRIGLVDYDEVEINNLHRQMLHSELKVNWSKVSSAQEALNKLNSSVHIVPYELQLDSSNALDLIQKYDIIVDATDNVPTRYLLNDACVLAKKTLVSGSALRFDGQLTVYNYDNGPCYRCLYPKPPPPETVGNCSDVGVLGVVPGIIGSLQALEVIKIAVGLPVSFNKKLLLFDGLESKFTTIKLRGRQKLCAVCGDSPSIFKLQDYEQFCSMQATDKTKTLSILSKKDRITVQEYKKLLEDNVPHVLIDVRPAVEFEICSLPTCNNLNIPIEDLTNNKNISQLKDDIERAICAMCKQHTVPVIAVCHNGNESQKAVLVLKEWMQEHDVSVKDIAGGLALWSLEVDPTFPKY